MRRRAPIAAAMALSAGLLLLAPAAAVPPRVVVSILPLHSLAAAVMTRVAEPVLLLRGEVSPHVYALRPSEARRLQEAEVVFWVGPALEAFLVRPLQASEARNVELMAAPGLELLPLRTSGVWLGPQRGGLPPGPQHPGDQLPSEPGPAEAAADPHIWLSPANAIAIAHYMAAVLAELDPERADRYRANAEALREQLARLQLEIEGILLPVRERPYAVFHDGYQYFEASFGLQPVGSLVLHPEFGPGAKRLQALREEIVGRGVVCVFSEPQFDATLVQRLLEGTGARTGMLDPLGSTQTPGAGAYPQLLRGLAGGLAGCLGVD